MAITCTLFDYVEISILACKSHPPDNPIPSIPHILLLLSSEISHKLLASTRGILFTISPSPANCWMMTYSQLEGQELLRTFAKTLCFPELETGNRDGSFIQGIKHIKLHDLVHSIVLRE